MRNEQNGIETPSSSPFLPFPLLPAEFPQFRCGTSFYSHLCAFFLSIWQQPLACYQAKLLHYCHNSFSFARSLRRRRPSKLPEPYVMARILWNLTKSAAAAAVEERAQGSVIVAQAAAFDASWLVVLLQRAKANSFVVSGHAGGGGRLVVLVVFPMCCCGRCLGSGASSGGAWRLQLLLFWRRFVLSAGA